MDFTKRILEARYTGDRSSNGHVPLSYGSRKKNR